LLENCKIFWKWIHFCHISRRADSRPWFGCLNWVYFVLYIVNYSTDRYLFTDLFLDAVSSVSFLQMSTSRSLALPPALPKVSAPLWSALLKLDLMGGSFSIAQKNRFACKNWKLHVLSICVRKDFSIQSIFKN